MIGTTVVKILRYDHHRPKYQVNPFGTYDSTCANFAVEQDSVRHNPDVKANTEAMNRFCVAGEDDPACEAGDTRKPIHAPRGDQKLAPWGFRLSPHSGSRMMSPTDSQLLSFVFIMVPRKR